jgi:hypothetical protein
MPIYVECSDLPKPLKDRCVAHYGPIYERNMSGVMTCVGDMSRAKKPASEQLKCVQHYGAHCPTDRRPPAGVPVRGVIMELFRKYILPLCSREAQKPKNPPRVTTAARFLANAQDYIKS